jgi:hypothetical protein
MLSVSLASGLGKSESEMSKPWYLVSVDPELSLRYLIRSKIHVLRAVSWVRMLKSIRIYTHYPWPRLRHGRDSLGFPGAASSGLTCEGSFDAEYRV